MSQYQKPCIFCGLKIEMSDSSGKWLPYNLDGTLHECKGKQSQQQPQAQPQPRQEQEQQSEQTKTVWAILEDYNKRLKKS